MTDVIKDMLNAASMDMRYKKIFIEDIDPSPYNRYPMQDIEDLAENIREAGLLHPITLYEKEDGRFMILSGERRYRAMLLNYTHGDDRWEEVPAVVKSMKLDEREIKRLIRRGNANRESLPKDIKIEMVKESLDDYVYQKENRQVPAGMLKRKWISMDTGFSERSVQDYLNIIENKNCSDKSEKRSPQFFYTDVCDQLQSKLQTKVKISRKKIEINYTNEEDLNRLLEIMGFLEL